MSAKVLMRGLLAVALLASAATAQAVTIDLVPVGNPGNAGEQSRLAVGDTTYYGGVAEPYLIGKYEITNAQWREFLVAKASVSDPYGLYNDGMYGIVRTWSVDHYVYTANNGDANWDNRPVNYVNFWDAARFCNWLQNNQGSGDTETGAYINIGNQFTFARQSGAKFFIPTENEWYKAAYYDPGKPGGAGYWDYPTKSDAPPINTLLTPDPGNHANFYDDYGTGNGTWTIGSPYYMTMVGNFKNSASAYGTFDQGGNLWEWTETTATPYFPLSRVWRGGSYPTSSDRLAVSTRWFRLPTDEESTAGFRVASVPEPGTIALLIAGTGSFLLYAWRRKRAA